MIRMNAVTPQPCTEDATPGGPAPSDDMTRAIERLIAIGKRSTTEMLSELRREFPDAPLSVRVRALEALRKRSHIPR
jgi:hypothetical protein